MRSALACAYILRHHSIPPMELTKLMEGLVLEPELISEIQRLVELKSTVEEAYVIGPHTRLITYIEKVLTECEVYLEEPKPSTAIKDAEPLNEHFRNWVKAKR